MSVALMLSGMILLRYNLIVNKINYELTNKEKLQALTLAAFGPLAMLRYLKHQKMRYDYQRNYGKSD